MTIELRQIACELFERGMIEFRDARLKDGRMSPVYVNMRSLPSYPLLEEAVAREMLKKMFAEQLRGTRIAGLPTSGTPLAVSMGLIGRIPALIPRQKAVLSPGEMPVEGFYRAGDQVVVIDDVLTDGAVKRHQVGVVRAAGLEVLDLLVVVDREEGGAATMDEAHVRTWSLLTLRQAVETIHAHCQLAEHHYRRTTRFMDGDPEWAAWRTKEVRAEEPKGTL